MRLDELDICCARPMLVTEERRIPSASPLVAPLWQMRIVCENCGKSTYWVDDYSKATRLWQGEEFEICQ